MKRFISLFICCAMVLMLVPAFSAAASTTDTPTVCNVLFEEDFEGTSTLEFVAYDSVAPTVAKSAVSSGAAYGQGAYNYSLSNLDTSGASGIATFKPGEKLTQNMLAGWAKGEGRENYGVEISFDWNPADYNKTKVTSTLVLKGRGSSSADNTGSFVTLLYTGGDKEASVHNLQITNGYSLGDPDESDSVYDLNAAPFNITYQDSSHVYRVRIVLKPYDETQTEETTDKTYNWAGDMAVYVDGVKLYDDKYREDSKETHVSALFVDSSYSSEVLVDNIKVVEYYDSLTSGTNYVNDDALVTAIRNTEADSSYTTAQAKYITDNAKSVYENANRTQTMIDSAVSKISSLKTEVANASYTLLHTESFENSDYKGATDSLNSDAAAGSVTAVESSDVYYGMGSKYYSAAAGDATMLTLHQFDAFSASLQSGNGYSAEIAFDYLPPANDANILITCANAGSVIQKSNSIATIYFDSGEKTFRVTDRDGAELVGNAAYTPLEPMRIRLKFTSTAISGTKAGNISMNVNGSEVFMDKPYINNAKETFLAGVSLYAAANKSCGSIDNITLTDVTKGAPVDKDALVAAIRQAGAVSDAAAELGMTLDSNFNTLVSAAKTEYENSSAEQTAVSSAAAALSSSLEAYSAEIAEYERIAGFSWENVNPSETSSKGKQQDTVYEDLYLPTTYYNGTETLDVIWESSDTSIIDNMGYVTRPVTNKYVTLTARFSEGGGTVLDSTKSFKVRVLAGGDVTLNFNDGKVREKISGAAFPTTGKSKLLVGVSGEAAEYSFMLEKDGKAATHTFTEDGDYDCVFEKSGETYAYTMYQNGVEVGSGTTEISVNTAVSAVWVTGSQITKAIGIELDTDKAYVQSVEYSDGTYTYGAPVPESALTKVNLKLREAVSDAKVFAAVYTDDKLYAVKSAPVSGEAGASVSAAITDVKLPDANSFENAVVKILLLADGTITPLMESEVYDASEIYDERIVVYMIGDSTMETNSASSYPRMGWGQVFGNYFDETKVVVDNRALSGRTTRWFKENGEFDKIMGEIKPGDYLFMQFGHNDQKAKNNVTLDQYKEFLTYFVEKTQEKGAIPVICSPISRRTYTDAGVYNPEASGNLRDHAAAAKAVADAKEITYIDLLAYSETVLTNLTAEESTALYFIIPNYITLDANKMLASKYYNSDGTYDAVTDNSHFSEYGVNVWAKYAAYALSLTNLSIAEHVTVTDAPAEDLSSELETLK